MYAYGRFLQAQREKKEGMQERGLKAGEMPSASLPVTDGAGKGKMFVNMAAGGDTSEVYYKGEAAQGR